MYNGIADFTEVDNGAETSNNFPRVTKLVMMRFVNITFFCDSKPLLIAPHHATV